MGDREPYGLDSAGMKGRAGFSFSFFKDRLYRVRIGCRNPRERCDAAVLKNREPGVLGVYWKVFGGIVLGTIWALSKKSRDY